MIVSDENARKHTNRNQSNLFVQTYIQLPDYVPRFIRVFRVIAAHREVIVKVHGLYGK